MSRRSSPNSRGNPRRTLLGSSPSRRVPPSIIVSGRSSVSASALLLTNDSTFPSSPTATTTDGHGAGVPLGDTSSATIVHLSSSSSGHRFQIDSPLPLPAPNDGGARPTRGSELPGSGAPASDPSVTVRDSTQNPHAPAGTTLLSPHSGAAATARSRQLLREDLQDLSNRVTHLLAASNVSTAIRDAWAGLLQAFICDEGLSRVLADSRPAPLKGDEGARAWAYYFICWKRLLERVVPGSALLSVGPDDISQRAANILESGMSTIITRYWHSGITFQPRPENGPSYFLSTFPQVSPTAPPHSGTAESFSTSSSHLSAPPPLRSGHIFSLPNITLNYDTRRGPHSARTSTISSETQGDPEWVPPSTWETTVAGSAPAAPPTSSSQQTHVNPQVEWNRSTRQVLARVSEDLVLRIDRHVSRGSSREEGEELMRLSNDMVRELREAKPDDPIEEVVDQLRTQSSTKKMNKKLQAVRGIWSAWEDKIRGMMSRIGSPAPSPARTLPPSPTEVQPTDLDLPPLPLTPIQAVQWQVPIGSGRGCCGDGGRTGGGADRAGGTGTRAGAGAASRAGGRSRARA
ncbi:hypothetical protein NMY22_g16375 [Coprinellus aureogranulatus]|nr:hypothetical protein NMY22_g16375 [Coprinellus aureogranulatus]